MSGDGKLSFKIRRPSPVSRASSTGDDPDFKVPALPRHLSGASRGSTPGSSAPSPKRSYEERDSSDEDEQIEDELVTGFDQFGVQRLHEKKKPQGPLVIAPLKNRDWRELARKRKNLYVPPSAAAETGADGSVGGLGTRDSINSGPQSVGLHMRKKVKVEDDAMETEAEEAPAPAEETVKAEEESEDQKALRALLSGSDGVQAPRVEVIPAVTEDDAYLQDVQELPESASLDDYERVPVEDFGAALLRGMGWKEGQAASRKGKGPVEPWLPQARPALLGIGAKEKEVFDDGSNKKKGRTRANAKYMPLLKVEKRPGEDDTGSGSSSRHRSSEPRSSRRSPSPDRRRDRDRDHHDSDYDRDRERKRDKERDRDRDRDRDYRDRDRDREGDRDRDRKDRDRDYDRKRDDRRDYDSSSRRRDRSSDRSRRDRDRRD